MTVAPSAMHGILVTYRRVGALSEMLERLTYQKRRLDTLVVIDNDPQKSAKPIVTSFAQRGAYTDRLTYIAMGVNAGPAGGIARGMRALLAYAAENDWIVSLDDDDPPGSDELFADLERLGQDLRDRGNSVGGVGLVGGRFSPARARALRVPDSELVGPVRCHWIGGNQFPCYVVGAISKVGVFDESLFFGFDDLDFGLRISAAGYGIFAHGDLWKREREIAGRLSYRDKPSSTLGDPSWRRYYSTRNMIYILRKQRCRRGAARLVSRSIVKPLVNLPRHPRLALKHLALNVRAISDAYTANMGRTVSPD